MNTTTVAPVVGVDLAKNVFELAIADENWRITERARLSRSQFERWFVNRQVGLVVMEACGSAHHWARWLSGLGIEVKLLPPRYVRAKALHVAQVQVEHSPKPQFFWLKVSRSSQSAMTAFVR